MISFVATISFAVVVVFIQVADGSKCRFLFNHINAVGRMQHDLGNGRTPGSFGSGVPPRPKAAPRFTGFGGFFTVTRKYFAVVAGMLMVCCNTAPGVMRQMNL